MIFNGGGPEFHVMSPIHRAFLAFQGDILPFLAFGYVVGQCQGQSFLGFNSSSELALCHRILIFGLKMVIFDEFWQPNPEQ